MPKTSGNISVRLWSGYPVMKRRAPMNTGYFPGVATIGDKIVGVENRDGNANVKIAQAETLERIYKSLKDNKIYVANSRMDAGSYGREIIEAVAKNSRHFYIRANRSEATAEQIRRITDWQTVEINFIEYRVASIEFTQFLRIKIIVSSLPAKKPLIFGTMTSVGDACLLQT